MCARWVGLVAALCLLHTEACTARDLPARRRLIIKGEEVSSRDRYPYICSIRNSVSGAHLCGATLISPSLAITAAYCVTKPGGQPDPLLWCGLHEGIYNDTAGRKDVLQTVHTTRHEFYQAATYCNDVALLELNASARVGRPIGHILEPGQFTFTPESNFTALGFGAVGLSGEDASVNTTEDRPFPNTLREVDLPFVPHEECDNEYVYDGRVLEPMMFCAGYMDGSADTCSGDSGGPLISREGSTSYQSDTLVGLVSWGSGCARPGWPGVYVRVDHFADWVVQNGFCACARTGISGGTSTGRPGCSAATEKGEAGAVGKQWCYVMDPARCPFSRPSNVHAKAGWMTCGGPLNSTSMPGGELYAVHRIGRDGFTFPFNGTCPNLRTES